MTAQSRNCPSPRRHRLISWLLRQAREEGRSTERGPFVALTAGHQELASQIGTVRDLGSRNLARLQAEGFISVSGREVTILDVAGREADLSSVLSSLSCFVTLVIEGSCYKP